MTTTLLAIFDVRIITLKKKNRLSARVSLLLLLVSVVIAFTRVHSVFTYLVRSHDMDRISIVINRYSSVSRIIPERDATQ